MQFLSTCLSLIAVSFVPLAEAGLDGIHKKQASAYFEALITADAEKADPLTAVPFSLDGEKILKTAEEVKAVHQTIATKKGKRPLPNYTIEKTDKAPALDATVFPKYVVYRVSIENSKKHVDVYLTSGAAPKVIGFAD